MDENEIKKLLGLRKSLSELVKSKQDQMEKLSEEIDMLSEKMNEISQMVSVRSFQSASSLLDDTDSFLEKREDVTFENCSNVRKIFSHDDKTIATIRFENNVVEIMFPFPGLTRITQEMYIEQFVKPVLLNIKKIETELKANMTQESKGNLEFVRSISLENIKNFESFDLIFEKIQEIVGQNF